MIEDVKATLRCHDLPVHFASRGTPIAGVFSCALGTIYERHQDEENFEDRVVVADSTSTRYRAFGSRSGLMDLPGDRAPERVCLMVDAVEIWNEPTGDRMVILRLRREEQETFLTYASSDRYALLVAMRSGF